jgi:hypothetical protein
LARVTTHRRRPNASDPNPPSIQLCTTVLRPVQTPGVGGIEKRTSSCMSAASPSASARSLHST